MRRSADPADPLMVDAARSSDDPQPLPAPYRLLVVLCGFIGMMAGFSSTYLYTAGLFLLPAAEEFDLSRGQASLGPLFCTLTAAAFAPVLGQVLDRVGAVAVALLSLFGLALGFFLLAAFSSDLGSYVGLSILLAVLGGGSTGLSFSRLVLGATTRHRGMSLGFVMAGVGCGALVLPPLLMPMIQDQGWRSAYQFLAALPLGAAVLLAVILLPIRRRLIASPMPGGLDAGSVKTEFSAPWRYPQFWPISGLFFLLAAASVSLVVHFVPVLIGAGVDAVGAASVASLIGLSSIPGRLVVGYLLDRYPLRQLTFLVGAVALLVTSLLAIDAARFGVPAAILLGVVMGAESDLSAFYTLRYFPERRYGSAFGAIVGVFLVGGAFGPTLAAHLHDMTNGYSAALAAIGLLFVAALVLVKRMPPPQAPSA